MKVTVAAVNKALAEKGFPERLRRGQGYFYFRKGEAHGWYESSVYVNRVDAFTIEGWLKERERLANA